MVASRANLKAPARVSSPSNIVAERQVEGRSRLSFAQLLSRASEVELLEAAPTRTPGCGFVFHAHKRDARGMETRPVINPKRAFLAVKR